MKKKKKQKISPQMQINGQSLQQEKATAGEMRFKAMETMGQTQKRVEKSNGVTPAKKSRKSTGDAIGYLEKKADQEMVLRRDEIEMRKQEEVRSSHLLRHVKDHSTIARGAAEAAAKTATATATIYAVHVEPATAAVTGFASPD